MNTPVALVSACNRVRTRPARRRCLGVLGLACFLGSMAAGLAEPPAPARLLLTWRVLDAAGSVEIEAAAEAATGRHMHADWQGKGIDRALSAATYFDGKAETWASGTEGIYRPVHRDPAPPSFQRASLFDVAWVFLPQWQAELEARPDVARTEAGGLLTTRSEMMGFELMRDAQGLIVGFASRLGPDATGAPLWVERHYEDFQVIAGARLPKHVRAVVRSRPQTGKPQWDKTAVYELIKASSDAAEVERALMFSPTDLGVSRLDPATSDVYDEQGKLLYNQKRRADDALAAFAGTSALRPWLYGASGLVVVVALALAVRRSLGRSAA